eukprot:CAMPEP_0178957656 /NCGR_PEP_ID=MMETSP0789-20121207/11062_1 /TAXON_ID=3005 /ORGANISM="Rhizosolenia setigera, Strain CCMP 1694" /LENGTH=604 /DNA_ID=CAMNT_0020639983 /DNA_START=40 /DNA_END=1855 /DNA_ORIENTATION=-
MKLSLLLSISAICPSDAFTIQKLSSPSVHPLNALPKKEPIVIDPDDPYANLLKAYGKKSVVVEEPKEIAIGDPDTVTPSSSSASLDSITDAANQAIAAAQEAVKAASDLGSTASSTTTPSSSGDVAPPLVDFLKEPEKFKSMADQASSSVEKVLSVVNSPSTPSTTGASTGATAVEPGKTVTLYQYLVNPATHTSSGTTESSFDAIANAKEKFSLMLENTLKFSNSVTESTTSASGELTKGLVVPASMKSTAGATAAGATAAAAGFDLNSVFNSAEWDQLAKNLNLEEYGAWYVAALALFFGANQSAAKKSATNAYEKEMSMAKEKADVAASAALDAVEQVQKAKELASTKTTTATAGGVKTDLLSEAKVRELQVEKDMLQEELLTTKALVSQLQSQLSLLNTNTDTAASITSSPEIKIATKTSSERDPEEDMRFVELLKGIDDANSKTKKKKKKKKTTTKTKTKKKATKKTTKKKKEPEPEPEPEPVAVVEEPEPEPIEEEKVSTVKKAAKKKATKKKKKKKKQTTTTAAKTKAVEPETIPEATTPTTTEEHPWAKLSTSTLSRKTVAELTGFLTEKGIAVADAESGKTFTKKVLVAEVQKVL